MNERELAEYFKKFFECGRVKEVLATIKECGISGWEVWLQVEFAHYLQKKVYKEEEVKFDWHREYKITNGAGSSIIPDFWVSSDSNDKSYFLIELKRSNSGKLKEKMKRDIKKWQGYIEQHGDILECAGDPETYSLSGIFFVGVDTNPNYGETNIEADKLVNYGMPDKYRLDFLPV